MRKALIGAGIGLAAALCARAPGPAPICQRRRAQDLRLAHARDGRLDAPATTSCWSRSTRKACADSSRWSDAGRGRGSCTPQLLNYLARAAARRGLRRPVHRTRPAEVLRPGRGMDRRRVRRRLAAAARKHACHLSGDAVPEALEGALAPPSAEALPSLVPRTSAPSTAGVRAADPPVAAAARGVAHNFAALDADGPLRRYVPFMLIRAARFRRWRSPRRRRGGSRRRRLPRRRPPADHVRRPPQPTARRLIVACRSTSCSTRNSSSSRARHQSSGQNVPRQDRHRRRDGPGARRRVHRASGGRKVGGLEVHAAVVDGILAGAGRGAGRARPPCVDLRLRVTWAPRRASWAMDHDCRCPGFVGRDHCFATWRSPAGSGIRSSCRCWR